MNESVVSTSFQPIYRHPCWGLHRGRYVNLSMSFGLPKLRVIEPYKSNSKSENVRRAAARRSVSVKGQWWLWIYCCYWRLSLKDQRLATGSSSARAIERALKELAGQALTAMQWNTTTGATRFTFDLGCVLECRRFERTSTEELWLLYKPNGFVLSVCGNGDIKHTRSSEA